MKDNFINKPLAERIRPKNLDDFFGQEHLVGEDAPLRKMIETDNLFSLILWGPPGTGKTTLAKIISEKTDSVFFSINAVSSGIKDVREIIEKAKQNISLEKKTILFIDEIHRFNKSQQDALLSAVESGLVTLIGATTENPSFEVISALRSRTRIYVLKELDSNDLKNIISYALKNDIVLIDYDIEIVDLEYLIISTGGDARSLLNTLEMCVILNNKSKVIKIDKQSIDKVLQRKNIVYDKNAEEHYNVISAFIKSIRGSDPDASLYWLARMIEGGEDPLFIARRLLILSSEDIGNASPNALLIAEATFSALEKIGMPEGRIILAQCVTYLATSPKSNASYLAVDKALSDVRNGEIYNVPLHLRNAPTKLMKDLGYSNNYKYPHNYDKNFIEEKYMPVEIINKQYYLPTECGFEKTIKDRLKEMWKKIKKY